MKHMVLHRLSHTVTPVSCLGIKCFVSCADISDDRSFDTAFDDAQLRDIVIIIMIYFKSMSFM